MSFAEKKRTVFILLVHRGNERRNERPRKYTIVRDSVEYAFPHEFARSLGRICKCRYRTERSRNGKTQVVLCGDRRRQVFIFLQAHARHSNDDLLFSCHVSPPLDDDEEFVQIEDEDSEFDSDKVKA
jgi:hypothetical protein